MFEKEKKNEVEKKEQERKDSWHVSMTARKHNLSTSRPISLLVI